METDYDVGVLDAADVYRAFAVVQLVMSGLDLQTWERLTASASLRRNWLAVTDARGYVRGLCHVFAREHPVYGRQLEIPVFASIGLVDNQGVAKRLSISPSCARNWTGAKRSISGPPHRRIVVALIYSGKRPPGTMD
ncbi:hypothetical protein LZK73_04930 [Neorhizobium galegae]|nr:hypothetical protein LZK73_04930 [Neorhizobium galegae]